MTNPPNTPQRASYTARTTLDLLGLGRTPGQRAAEILAGLRAVEAPSPEAVALSSPAGRLFGRLVRRIVRDRSIVDSALARPAVMTALAARALERAPHPMTMVELAAGMGTRGIEMARSHPDLDVIEIDLPGVIEEKRARLRRHRIDVPSNIRWLAADLAITPLRDLLGGRRAGLVVMEGMLPYFPHDTITAIVATIRDGLAPGGVVIADVMHRGGWHEVRSDARLGSWLTSRQVGRFLGAVAGEPEARELFVRAGYANIVLHRLPEAAAEIGLRSPVRHVSFLVVAGDAEVGTGERSGD